MVATGGSPKLDLARKPNFVDSDDEVKKNTRVIATLALEDSAAKLKSPTIQEKNKSTSFIAKKEVQGLAGPAKTVIPVEMKEEKKLVTASTDNMDLNDSITTPPPPALKEDEKELRKKNFEL